MKKVLRIMDYIVEGCLICFLFFIAGYILYASYSITFLRLNLFQYERYVVKLCSYAIFPTLYLVIRKKIYRRKDFLFLCLMITGLLISYIYSVNQNISLYGRRGRFEGMTVILCYYQFYLIASMISNKKVKKVLLLFLLGIGLVQVGYGYLQTNQSLDRYHSLTIIRKWIYALGFVGNSNFYSSFMVLFFFVNLGIYLYSKSLWSLLPFYLVTSLFFLGILLGGAMSGVVAFFLIFFFAFIIGIYLYHIKNKNRSDGLFFLIKFLALLPIFAFCIFLEQKTTEGTIVQDFASMFMEVKEGVNEESGSGRIKIWKETLPIIPKYLLTGSGVDTFYEAFGGDKIVINSEDTKVDKAHNEYLQILVTEGILSTIGYLGLIFITCLHFFKRILKKEITPLELSLLLAVLAYLVQAFFNIRVTRVAPYFFMIFGLLNSHLDRYGKNDEKMIE